MSSTKFVFFGLIKKSRRPPKPLIGWNIFDFFQTAEQNSTKLDRKQDLNVLYQVCVFSGWSLKKRWPPWPMIGWDIFDFSSETAERESKKFDRKQDLNIFYQVVFFSLMSKLKLPPWPICQKGGTLYSGARYVALWASCLCIYLGEGRGGGCTNACICVGTQSQPLLQNCLTDVYETW